MKLFGVVSLISLLLCSCQNEPKEPTGVIPQAQKEALQKAKGLGAELKQQEQARREQLNRIE